MAQARKKFVCYSLPYSAFMLAQDSYITIIEL